MNKPHAPWLAAIGLSAALLSPLSHAKPTLAPSAYAPVAAHYATLVHASYSDTLAAALDLQSAVASLVKTPSAQTLNEARRAWLAAREFYGQTEAFRFYAGPIDDDQGPEGRINAWPLDEAYIDGVRGRPAAGLVNDARFAINKTGLIKRNEKGGEENIATGWHAIEFLLWGQDHSATAAGQRSHEDYVQGKGANAMRRGQYLNTVTALLIDDLRSLLAAWQPGKRNFRARFERGGRESVRKILVGLGSLSRGELAGERMEVALNSQDQEDEHSCFSDNTHRDIVANAQGIQNVWLGQYQRRDGSVVKGPGLNMLVAQQDAQLAQRVSARLDQSLRLAQTIPAPFDQAIRNGAPGRPAVEQTVASLVAQSDLLVAAAAAVGITKLTLVQP